MIAFALDLAMLLLLVFMIRENRRESRRRDEELHEWITYQSEMIRNAIDRTER